MSCNNPRPRKFPNPPTHRTGRRTRIAGFSLVELMVVLVLIGLLASIVTVNVRHYLVQGKQSAAQAEIHTISLALETFYSIHGRYPTNAEGLAILATASTRMAEPLLTRIPTDPWGQPYQYLSPGRQGHPFEVISYGADGREGGEGADADISSATMGNAEAPR